MKRKIMTFIKGFFIGSTMLVPGVSGGTMAMVLGIYEKLISSISSFMKHKRASLAFLLVFCLGSFVGMVLVANPLLALIEAYPGPVLYFFIGAVLGGIPMILKRSQIRAFSFKLIFFASLGAVSVLLISMIPKGTFSLDASMDAAGIALLIAAGFFAAIALVLPGISVSYVLLIMGMYDDVIHAVGKVSLPYLIPLAVGLFLGIILTTRILENIMTKYPQATHILIIGFILGSVIEVSPPMPKGYQWFVCIGLFALGFIIIQMLYRFEKKIEMRDYHEK